MGANDKAGCLKCYGRTTTYDGKPCPRCGGSGKVDLVDLLRKRYTEETVPPCRVCGAPLSVQRCGGGEPTIWACDGLSESGSGMVHKEGRSFADEHYTKSRFTQYRVGDSDVLAACDLIEELRKHQVATDAVEGGK